MCWSGLLFAFFAAPAPIEEVPLERLDEIVSVDAAAFQRFLPVIDPLGQLRDFVRRTESGFEVRFRRDDGWRALQPKPGLASDASSNPLPFDEANSLAGLRIVLDPGHRGGAWSRQEERHVSVGPGPAVREGDLTHAVAVQLESMLRARGADVQVTRGAPPRRRFPAGMLEGFDPSIEAAQWATELAHVPALSSLARWQHTRLGRWAMPFFLRFLETLSPFKLYNRFELRRRAEIAAQFDPHVTLSLHFNVARDPLTNGIIVFVLGNFVDRELATVSQRFYALRALTSGVLEPSRRLAVTLGRAMKEELSLDALSEPPDRPLGYAKKIPLVPEDGVFARNLAMIRRTPGVVLLLEGPCMNAVGEFEKLQRRDTRVPGLGRVSHRTTQFARAVVRALATHRELLLRSRGDL